MFIIRYWKVLLPIAGAVVLAGTFFGYGAMKYHSGYQAAQEELKSKIETITIKKIKAAGQNKEKVKKIEESLDDIAVNSALRSLDIMRRPDDY